MPELPIALNNEVPNLFEKKKRQAELKQIFKIDSTCGTFEIDGVPYAATRREKLILQALYSRYIEDGLGCHKVDLKTAAGVEPITKDFSQVLRSNQVPWRDKLLKGCDSKSDIVEFRLPKAS